MRLRFATLVLAALFMGGCTSTGVFNSSHLTNVQLTEGNYDVVATNVSGESSAYYIFGVSGAVGTEMRSAALARVGGDGMLYEAAFDDLWSNFEDEYGPATDRSLALVNVRYDSDALNLIFFTRPQVSIRADVVEFE